MAWWSRVVCYQRNAALVFNNLRDWTGLAQRLHECVMNRQYKILEHRICLKVNDLQADSFALVDMHVTAMRLHAFVVRKLPDDSPSFRGGAGFTRKHTSDKPVPDYGL